MLKKKIYIIVVLLALVFASLSFLLVVSIGKYSLGETMVYHEELIDYEVNKGTALKYDDNGNATLTINGKDVDQEMPLYSLDNTQLLTLKEYAYYLPSLNQQFSKTRFSSLTKFSLNGGIITCSKNNKTKNCNSGFLYDGNDSYIFLDSGTLQFDGYSISVDSLSTAIVNLGDYLSVFNTETGSRKSYTGPNEVYFVTSNYSINLSTDTVTYGDSEYYLNSNFNLFEYYLEVSE